MAVALFSSAPPSHFVSLAQPKPHLSHKSLLFAAPQKPKNLLLLTVPPISAASAADNGSGAAPVSTEELNEKAVNSNGSAAAAEEAELRAFRDPRWIGGTWDLGKFQTNGKTNWDAVIDAEVRRRKWLQDNPEPSSNESSVVFDTSIIPWWAWMKRFHLPEAEILNGRAAMIGFFMAYFVDALTGVGLVDQTNNFLCKTLLFVAVGGVLLIRKNEDIETIKKLVEETTFYDKQWQATWQDETPKNS
ncbi:unnamed protein product [Cuscuta campestris]|uniref:Lil3 protein n=1 Tax=Cuscuta campestris TaxID=132261 RepID=A0A484MB83_9ASTE|nr:unnamed protein product [Cuscuta campestris]